VTDREPTTGPGPFPREAAPRPGNREGNPRSADPCPCGSRSVTDPYALHGPAVLPPLRLGPYLLTPPVVLAPMAGVTNPAFRRLCREYLTSASPVTGSAETGSAENSPPRVGPYPGEPEPSPFHGENTPGAGGVRGIFVSEMVTARALIERNVESLRLIAHDPDEHPRSIQVHGTDPRIVGEAVHLLVHEGLADHIDLNFGCPVPKVTRRGGGAVLPWKTELFAAIVRGAVRAAGPGDVPVTVKIRKGIDEDHLSYLSAGRAARDEGAAAVTLHGRTAADHYSGTADRTSIAHLKTDLGPFPVLGNGDLWSAQDALDLVRQTGCDGVVVGRGALGRPWIFADLAAALVGRNQRYEPDLGEVLAVMRRHLELLRDHFGATLDRGDPVGAQARACRDFRKHVAWYLKGYEVGREARCALALIDSLDAFDRAAARLDHDRPHPGAAACGPRGRGGSARPVSMPDGWLLSQDVGSPCPVARCG
jgi:nifR3 family TIM-barrel protein